MAQVDYFLKIDGIEGESADSKHKGEIDLQSWGFGASQSGTMHSGGGGGAGKVSVQDLHFVTNVSKASPKLFLACANGEHIKKAVLVARKAGKEQQEYMKITMSDLLVSNYQTGGSSQDGIVPVDQASLNFAKIEIEYKEQKPDGSLGGIVKAGYNMKENKAV
jgi:type VI secretion system secreted protein Hcp